MRYTCDERIVPARGFRKSGKSIMVAETNRRRARKCFVVVILLGLGVSVFGHAWLAAYAAASTDVVLTREELNEPKLIEVV